MTPAQVCIHFIRVGIGCQHSSHLGAVQAALPGNIRQNLAITKITPLFKTCGQQRLGQVVLIPLANNIFLQLLGRNADSGGLNFYVNGLREGRFTLASIALNVADGTKDLDATIKTNKLRVANG